MRTTWSFEGAATIEIRGVLDRASEISLRSVKVLLRYAVKVGLNDDLRSVNSSKVVSDMTDYKIEEVVDLFFNAIQNGDESGLQSVYAEDVKVWHSFTGDEISKEENISSLMSMIKAGVKIRYALQEQLIVGTRVARRHLVTLTFASGKTILLPVCIFLTIEGNHITRLDEYIDSSDAKNVGEAAGTEWPPR